MKIRIERLEVEVPSELIRDMHRESISDPTYNTRMSILAALLPKLLEMFEKAMNSPPFKYEPDPDFEPLQPKPTPQRPGVAGDDDPAPVDND